MQYSRNTLEDKTSRQKHEERKRLQEDQTGLLNKYMDGATSNEEEATLRKYFEEHGNDIPAEWEL